MKKGYRLSLAVALLCGGLTASAFAQEQGGGAVTQQEFSKIGAGSGTFLNLPVGARGMALGSGFVAVADDPSALYWNPAGIMQIEGASASYSFTPMFAGIKHHFAGVTFPIGDAYKIGLSAIAYGTDKIEITDMFNQDGTGALYSVQDLAFGLTFSGQLTEQFSFGVTGKFVDLTFATLSANALAFDVGTMYKPGLLGLRIGFAVNNLSAPLSYEGSDLVETGGVDPITGNQRTDGMSESGAASLPLIFRAGVSSDVLEGDETNKLLIGTEFSTSSDRPEFVSIGAEYVWNDLLAVRAGYQFGSPDAYGISGGLGLNYDTGSFNGTINYAIRPHKTLGLVNQITASIRLQ